MSDMTKAEIEKLIAETVKKEVPRVLPQLLGRSLVQIKEFFIANIT